MSKKAIAWMRERGSSHAKAYVLCGESYPTGEVSTYDAPSCHIEVPRNDPLLIACVEALGKNVNGMCSELAIVEIPDDIEYEIDDYDGIETIHEKHRSW